MATTITSNTKVFHFKAMQSALADFKSLLNDESMSDVVFAVGGEKIRGHRQLIGARCEVLKTMLFGTFAGDGKEIDVGHDVQPDMFRRVLEFIYGGSVQIDDKNALPLMELAHKYSITNLEEACSSFLGKTLDVENVLPIYTVALQLSRKDLSDVSIHYIRSRAKEVFATAAFLDITEELLCSIMSDDELAMDELDLFDAALRWGKHRAEQNNEPLESVMSAVVQVIRFPLIGASKLINRVKPTGVVPIELYVEALEFSASPRTVNMDGSRFRKRRAPKLLATTGTAAATMSPAPAATPVARYEEEASPARGRALDSSQPEDGTPTNTSRSNSAARNARRTTKNGRSEELDEDSKIGVEAVAPQEHAPVAAVAPVTTPAKEHAPIVATAAAAVASPVSGGINTSAPTSAGRSKTPKSARATAAATAAAATVASPVSHTSSGPITLPPNAVEFKHERDYDENGVFYYVATNGRTADWENPATSGKVMVTSSAAFDWGSASNLLARKTSNTWTASQPGSWVSFSLRGLSVLPTQYTLRHGYVSDGANLRNWVLEGSTDGNSWHVLSTHSNDRSLGGNYGTSTWKIENAREFYQHYRIRSTGRDGGNSDRIQLCGLELYGYLTDKN